MSLTALQFHWAWWWLTESCNIYSPHNSNAFIFSQWLTTTLVACPYNLWLPQFLSDRAILTHIFSWTIIILNTVKFCFMSCREFRSNLCFFFNYDFDFKAYPYLFTYPQKLWSEITMSALCLPSYLYAIFSAYANIFRSHYHFFFFTPFIIWYFHTFM